MLWTEYPERLDEFTLIAACDDLQGDPPHKIPFLVWLLENPASPINMPGSIDLFGHDCIHLLLKQGFTPADEAYIVGFTIGNDTRTSWIHLVILKVAAYFFYPPKYRFTRSDIKSFNRGVALGKKVKFKNINKLDFSRWHHKKLTDIRIEFGLAVDSRVLQPA